MNTGPPVLQKFATQTYPEYFQIFPIPRQSSLPFHERAVMFSSRFFKFIWGANGLLIFFLALLGVLYAVILISAEFSNRQDLYEKGVVLEKTEPGAPQINLGRQHLFYDKPEKISGSHYYFAKIYIVDKEITPSLREQIKRANDISLDLFGGTVNVLFFRTHPDSAHSLLPGFGFISEMNVPNRYIKNKEPRKYILYKIALEDNNGDGRINKKDRSAYYISDPRGKNLQRITPDSLNLSYWIDRDNENLIFFSRVQKEKERNELGIFLRTRSLYQYNIATGKFRRLDFVQTLFDSLQKAYKQ